MDGVIFDTIHLSKKALMESHPGITEEQYSELHTGNFHEEIKKYSHLKTELTDEEEEKRKVAYSESKSKSTIFDGMKDLLVDLHKLGVILVLNTSAYNRNCLPLLEVSSMTNLFDFVADADLSKSKVEKFDLIVHRYNLAKEELLFVTDAVGDVVEAETAGIPTIAVTWGASSEAHFKKENYRYLKQIVNTVSDLRNSLIKF